MNLFIINYLWSRIIEGAMLKPTQGTHSPGNLLPAPWLCRGDFKTSTRRLLGQENRDCSSLQTFTPRDPRPPAGWTSVLSLQ